MWLLEKIVSSFTSELSPNIFGCYKGVPIGNLTSQIFANIYLNEFDQFIKHRIKVKHYLRYADDFVVVHRDKKYLESLTEPMEDFLDKKLKLKLHPNKIILKKYKQGADFLGYVLLPHYKVLRTKTKKRMFKNMERKTGYFNKGVVDKDSLNQTLQSYLGILSHCDSYGLKNKFLNKTWLEIDPRILYRERERESKVKSKNLI